MRHVKKVAAFFALFASLALMFRSTLCIAADASASGGYAIAGFAPSASLSATVAGGFAPTVAVSVSVTAETDSVLLFAVYSSEGQLSAIRTVAVTGRAGEQRIPLFPPDGMTETDRVKLFLLDRDTQKPLCSVVTTDSAGNVLDDGGDGDSMYAVSFDGNGQSVSIKARSVRRGETVSEPDAPVAEGYVFGGWYVDAACATAYNFSTPVEGSLTLYAKWTPAALSGHAVTFDLNTGLSYEDVTSKMPSYAEGAFSLMRSGYTGYSIDSWYTDENMTNPYTFRAAPNDELSLYSLWRNEDERYHVRFHGGPDDLSFTFTDVPSNGVLSPVDLPNVAGRDFEGWFDSPGDAVAHDFTAPVTDSLTLYAKWASPSARSCNAILYEDGTLVFQSSNSSLRGLITQAYDIKLIADYNGAYNNSHKQALPPWYELRNSIRAVEFSDPIRPLFTSYWFYGCSNLASVMGMENLDMSEVEGMNFMFYNCSSLTELDVSGWDTGNVREMSWAFGNCWRLTELDVSGWNTGKVRYASGLFSRCSGLKALDVSAWNTRNVTDMNYLFSGCSALRELDVSGWDTGNVRDMGWAFGNCQNLKALNVSGWNTQNVTDMNRAFYNCYSLSALDLSGWNTSNVTDMSWMFSDCWLLTGINASGWNTGAVVNMRGMFSGCVGFTTLDVSGFDTSSVTSMGYMFSYCKKLTTLDVSGFDTSSVTDMNNMFYKCGGLTTLNIKDLDTSHVTSMSSMFSGCGALKALDISGLDISSVSYMGYMFSECDALTTLNLNGLDTSHVTSMYRMFYECKGLTTLDLSGFDTSSVSEMSGMFSKCANLKTIYVSEKFVTDSLSWSGGMFSDCAALVGGGGTKYSESHADGKYACIDNPPFAPGYFTAKGGGNPGGGNSANSVHAILYDDGEMVFQIGDAPESGRTVTASYAVDMTNGYRNLNKSDRQSTAPWNEERNKIQSVAFADKISPKSVSYWFAYCSELKEISQIEKLDTSGVTNMRSMFAECKGLTALNLSAFNTARVTDMRDMFYGCDGLKTLDVSGFDTARVANMSDMFAGCGGLTALDVSGFNTVGVTDMSYMFSDCGKLTALDVSGFNTASVTDMSYMFNGCGELTALDVSGFNTASVTDMSYMFNGCGGLTALDVSGFDTARVTNMSNMFNGCGGLAALDVSGFDTARVSEMYSMFTYCWNLNMIYASEKFVTHSLLQDNNMFSGCSTLIGGAGTTYDWKHTDNEYARIDNPPSAPGYFTVKGGTGEDPANKVYAILYDDGEMVFQMGNSPESGRRVMAYYVVNMTGGYRNSESGGQSTTAPWNANRSSVQSVTFADAISPASLSYWFAYCYALREINHIERLDTASATDMSGMFSGCSELTALDVSGFNTASVTDMSGMFSGCNGLTTLDVSGFNTAMVTDMSHMFSGCSGLTALDVSGFNTASVTDMSYMFSNCRVGKLDVSGFNTASVRAMDSMFYQCSRLTTLDVSSFDTSNVGGTFGGMVEMFYDCSSLKTIYASEKFVADTSTYSYYYGFDMFAGCSALVGGAGTKYNNENTGQYYARIDNPPSAPGYFTAK